MSTDPFVALGPYLILWRYRVDPAHTDAFERTYGEEGPWSALFRISPDYRSSTLLRQGISPAGSYLLIDAWKDQVSYEAFLSSHRAEYDRLSATCSSLYLEEERLGTGTPIPPRS
jgi:hypothetical protein